MTDAIDSENIAARLPESPDAERAVLGAMLMDPDAISATASIIKAEDFCNKGNGILFETIVELNNEGTSVDDLILHDRLIKKGAPAEIADRDHLTSIVESVPISTNVEDYAAIVKEKSRLRQIIHLCQDTESECFKQDDDPKTILGRIEKQIFDMSQSGRKGELTPIREIVYNTMQTINRAAMTDGNITGIATGFTDLDYRLSGLQPADMVLIAARPSMGKTALALNIAAYVALHEKLPVAIFSLEMPKEALVRRLLSMESHIDAQNLRNGHLDESGWEELMRMGDRIAGSELIIDDETGLTPTMLLSKCRKIKMEHDDLSLVVIDYLQLMQGDGRYDSKQQEISDISRAIKQVAREINAPVIALSQLSRAPEQRPDHRPMLSDLRESGAIEQDADVVMFIYRDDYYHPDTEKKNISEINIAKQRNGPVGVVSLAWLPEYTKFANLERDPHEKFN